MTLLDVTNAVAALGAAGAAVASFLTVRQARAERADAAARQRQDFAQRSAADVARYQRDLLRQATRDLIDALWTSERELCGALDLARNAARDGVPVDAQDPSLVALGRLELAVKRGLLNAVPFIASDELRGRVLTASAVVNDCYNIRGGSMPEIPNGGTYDHFSRAMIEVQRYFQWLRRNLACAVHDRSLPPPVDVPQVRRLLEQDWSSHIWQATPPPPAWA